MKNNKKKIILNLILPIFLFIVSISLALVMDRQYNGQNLLDFGNVSIMEEGQDGSKLSITLENNITGNNKVLFDRSKDNQYFKVVPTTSTNDCYLRFNIRYTLGNDKLDVLEAETLSYLNDFSYLSQGIFLHEERGNYAFTADEDWFYLTLTSGDDLLKVVRKDNREGFIMLDKFVVMFDYQHEQEILELSRNYKVYLKVEVEVIQAYGVAELINENQTQSGENIDYEKLYNYATIQDFVEAVDRNEEEKTGNIRVSYNINNERLSELTQISNINIENREINTYIGKSGHILLPTTDYSYTTESGDEYIVNGWTLNGVKVQDYSTYKEILALSENKRRVELMANWQLNVKLNVTDTETELNSAFLGSKNVEKGGHESLARQNIRTLEFTNTMPMIRAGLVLNQDYFKVDCGEREGYITAYWIENGTHETVGTLYDVIVYQRGGVILNANSSNLFRNVGYYSLTDLNISKWDINTKFVTNMNSMFYRCGFNNLVSFNIGNSFDTSKVTNMNSMFEDFGRLKLQKLDLGPKFDTSNCTSMQAMFKDCGRVELELVDLRENFNTENVTNMSRMFYNFGYTKLTNLYLGEKFSTAKVTNLKEMFLNCGRQAMLSLDLGIFGEVLGTISSREDMLDELSSAIKVCTIVCLNTEVKTWLTSAQYNATYKSTIRVRDYSHSVATLLPSYGENKPTSAFLDSLNTQKGGHSSLTRQAIKSIKFTEHRPIMTNDYILNNDYFKVDCGIIKNTITAYWIKNGTYGDIVTYDVIVYQENGVVFNPYSADLLRNVGYLSMTRLDTNDWEINISKVTNMSGMFYHLGETNLESLIIGNNFNTSNVIYMASMFEGVGMNKIARFDLGSHFDTSNCVEMDSMFKDFGYYNLEIFNISDNFNTSKVVTMKNMFENFGYTKLTKLYLGEKFDTSKVQQMDNIFQNCGALRMLTLDLGIFGKNITNLVTSSNLINNISSTNKISSVLCSNSNVQSWFETQQESLQNKSDIKIRNYDYSIATLYPVFGESSMTSSFLDSFNTQKGGNETLTRQSIKSIRFTSTIPTISGTLNTDYYMVDSGLIEDTVTAYWIKNGTYQNITTYDVIVYQQDGVVLNPYSGNLFNSVGYYNMASFDTSTWAIDTLLAKDMSNMFKNFGYTQLKSIVLGDNFKTENVENMTSMFENAGYNKLTKISFGKNFNTSNCLVLDKMFKNFGYADLTRLYIGEKFDTLNVASMEEMFNGCGYNKMISLDLGILGERTNSLLSTTDMLKDLSSQIKTCTINCIDEEVKSWLENIQTDLTYKSNIRVRDYDPTKEILMPFYNENSQTSAFLGSTDTQKGGNAALTRQAIKNISFTSTIPTISNELMLNYDYFMVDCGLIEDTITAYWIANGKYGDIVTYDVIVYQQGGVVLNPYSANLFSYVGYYAMESFDTTEWNINTDSVTDMSLMFNNLGFTRMTSLTLGGNFNTKNVKYMSSMFENCGYTTLIEMNLGEKFITENCITMDNMFKNCGVLTSLDLGDNFNTKNVTTMERMFDSCGNNNLLMLELGNLGETRNNALVATNLINNLSTEQKVCTIICANEDVKLWLMELQESLVNQSIIKYEGEAPIVPMLLPCYDETEKTSGFLGSTNTLKGGNAALTRQAIASLTFTDTQPIGITGTAGIDYFVVDCGTVKNTIFAYWIYNTTAADGITYYDVTIYQDGGVMLNTDSSYLFANIDYTISRSISTTEWAIHTSHVTNMSSMFKNFGYSRMESFVLEENFSTESVENMSNMFENCGYTKLTEFNLGDNFNTTNVTTMQEMFKGTGYAAMTKLSLGNLGESRDNLELVTDIIKDLSSENKTCKVIVINEDVKTWLNTLQSEYTNKSKIMTLEESLMKATLKLSETNVTEDSGFLGSLDVNANLTRNVITSIELTDVKPEIDETTDFMVDVGTIEGEITAYWIFSRNYSKIPHYDVIIYQEGGVVLNEDSSYLFAYVGYNRMSILDATEWVMNTTNVTNMSSMFECFGYNRLGEIYLGTSFETINCVNVDRMFYDCGYESLEILSLGNFAVNNSTIESSVDVFTGCGENGLFEIYCNELAYDWIVANASTSWDVEYYTE